MLEWIRELLWDKAVFFAAARWVIATVGVAIDKGIVPTGIDHGDRWGLFIAASALLIKAGQQNPKGEAKLP